jgi:hypothetical protein
LFSLRTRTTQQTQAAIDLDQAMIQKYLSYGTDEAWLSAYAIYAQGAHSLSVATVNVNNGLDSAVKKGAPVVGFSTGARVTEVHGKLVEDYPANSPIIRIQYNTISVQDRYVGCQVGGSPTPNTDLCK